MMGDQKYTFGFRNREQIKHQLNAQQDNNSTFTCRSCSHEISSNADICEHCGDWQLLGNCCFCYTPVKTGQKFCGSCGNPPEGIRCYQCGTHSYFSFCPRCDATLAKDAKPFLESIQQSDSFLILKDLSDKIAFDIQNERNNIVIEDIKPTYKHLNEYLNKDEEVFKPAPQQNSFIFKNKIKDVSEELKKAEMLRISSSNTKNIIEEEKELRQKISALQNKLFSDNQSARKYYTALKLVLPQLVVINEKRLVGWLCNLSNTIHNGPSDCCEPNLGGTWIYEDKRTYNTEYKDH